MARLTSYASFFYFTDSSTSPQLSSDIGSQVSLPFVSFLPVLSPLAILYVLMDLNAINRLMLPSYIFNVKLFPKLQVYKTNYHLDIWTSTKTGHLISTPDMFISHCSLSQYMRTLPYQLIMSKQKQKLESLDSLTVYIQSKYPVCSTYKLYQESDYYSPLHLLLSWPKPLLSRSQGKEWGRMRRII